MVRKKSSGGRDERPTNSNIPSRREAPNSNRASAYGKRPRPKQDTSNPKVQRKRGELRWKKNNWDEVTGFSVGTEQNIIAHEILRGGTREEITERLRGKVTAVTKTGKPRQTSSQISAVAKKLRDRGVLPST